jgi:putative hydrolase of the HAD superfamily
VSAAALIACEGRAKRLLEDGAGTRATWDGVHLPGARSWGNLIGTICALSGVPEARLPELLARFWHVHMALNLWWLVPAGLGAALDAVREAGVSVVIVSNSEGMLDHLFAHLGIAKHFDLVVDSGKLGIEKPHPGIWEVAVNAYPVPPERVLHLGDTWATDTLGASRFGYRTALIDPHAHYAGLHPTVARAPGVVEVAWALARSVRTASRTGSRP